jgi:hypothetical protein
MSNFAVDHTVEEFFRTTNLGSIERSIGDNLYGIRYSPGKATVPLNKDYYGLTFFTRPQLNMQSNNLRNVRQFYGLLTDSEYSLQRYVRAILDPRIMNDYSYRAGDMVKGISAPLVDNLNAFIPVLTNNLLSISGFPDIAVPTYTSTEGVYGESQSFVDGLSENYSSYDVDASFKNTIGDPIIYMMYIWTKYMSYVFEGRVVPYPDFLFEREIDYNTRIYRLILDSNQVYVKKIFATGASFPVSVPTGGFADFNSEDVFNMGNKEFSIRFKCDGFIAFDEILVYEFNKTVCTFNPAMEDGNRGKAMVKVPNGFRAQFNNRAYPRIDPRTHELQWWVFYDLYNSMSTQTLVDNMNKDVVADTAEWSK